ncbi:MAG: hypothetical protein Kow0037_12740 [Calditrichia bacterium]
MGQGKKLKVLQISGFPPPRSGWGVRIAYLKEEIEKNGDICTVLNIGKSRKMRGQPFVPVFNGLDYTLKVLWFRLKGYKVHMHLNGDSPKGFVLSSIAVAISLLTFHRPIVTMHAGPMQFYFPREKAPRLVPVFKFIFGGASAIICNHDKVKENIAAYGINPEKIYPIPAFSRQYLQFEKTPLPEDIEQTFNGAGPVIVTYCAFRRLFFIEDVLRAFRKIRDKYPQAKLVFLGEKMPEDSEASEYIKELLQLMQELKIADAVLFSGDLEHDAFLTAISRATLYLRSPIKDGVSSSVLEALALKVPVVAVENPLRPPQVIIYRHQDLDDMVAKIDYAIRERDRIVAEMRPPEIRDTIKDEIEVIKKA